MDHLQLTSATADHLQQLLRRTVAPAPPSLPPGSRTAAALRRAAEAWEDTHRHADTALRDHVHEVERFLGRVTAVDAAVF